jgi:hypothetical protein
MLRLISNFSTGVIMFLPIIFALTAAISVAISTDGNFEFNSGKVPCQTLEQCAETKDVK